MKMEKIRIAQIISHSETYYVVLPKGFKKRKIDGDKINKIINISYVSATISYINKKGVYSSQKKTYKTAKGVELTSFLQEDGEFFDENEIYKLSKS